MQKMYPFKKYVNQLCILLQYSNIVTKINKVCSVFILKIAFKLIPSCMLYCSMIYWIEKGWITNTIDLYIGLRYFEAIRMIFSNYHNILFISVKNLTLNTFKILNVLLCKMFRLCNRINYCVLWHINFAKLYFRANLSLFYWMTLVYLKGFGI